MACRGLRKDNTGYDLRDLFIRQRRHAGHHHRRHAENLPRPAAQLTARAAVAMEAGRATAGPGTSTWAPG